MKNFLVLIILTLAGNLLSAQTTDYNIDGGYIAEGYDVVSYFDGKAQKGAKDYSLEYDGIKLKFANQENLDKFNADPEMYFPQYGGWCAYAMGAKAEKVSINPKTYEIRDGKLYLFYNSWGTNTLKKWLEEDPENLAAKADANWEESKHKK